MELGLLARAKNASSQFDDRIQKLFEMRRPSGEIIHRRDPTRTQHFFQKLCIKIITGFR